MSGSGRIWCTWVSR